MQQEILINFNKIKSNILKICKKINRNPDEINIVAVSKKQEKEKIETLMHYGHNSFGENRLEEVKKKWENINHKNIDFHYIGALQSKKVKDIIDHFNVIETLDTESSAKKIASIIVNNAKQPPKLFIQVNVGKEKQKRGISISEVENFLKMCSHNYKLNITGAMCIPPNDNKTEKYFKDFKDLCVRYNLNEISMGMSNDYEKAIEMGSTNIRIGTVLFGSR